MLYRAGVLFPHGGATPAGNINMLKNKRLKGVNLGGWLLMEGYILGGRNISESEFKRNFSKIHGAVGLREFERLFRDNFIREVDFKNISEMGANVVRLPFNHRLIETRPFVYSEEGFSYLNQALDWARKYSLGVILDLHAAPGAQNCDWHSDSDGRARLWENKEYQERTYLLWERIADRFKDKPALIGYDVLNEPVIAKEKIARLKNFYKNALRRIKAVDKGHLIFLEGNLWATQIDFLDELIEDNARLSIHAYEPLSYTFNFTPLQGFPGTINVEKWDKARIHRYLKPYADFARENKVRILAGEFGINWRGGFWGELDWLGSILDFFEGAGFDYTYWTYKAMAGSVFPDGLYQYLPNNNYILREGPVYGWENYIKLWKTDKNKIVDFWRTGNFTPNQRLISRLKRSFNAKNNRSADQPGC